jgi:hypothetical protein
MEHPSCSSEGGAREGAVAAELQAVAIEAAIFLFRALFEAACDDGVALGVAEKVGAADAGGPSVPPPTQFQFGRGTSMEATVHTFCDGGSSGSGSAPACRRV